LLACYFFTKIAFFNHSAKYRLKNLLDVKDLGLVDYQAGWDIQTDLHQRLIQEKRNNSGISVSPHSLILCEHPHVFTLGKSGYDSHLKVDDSELERIQASFYRINRGGDITYHGPGQLVAYPILDLERIFTDVHRYVRSLEEVVIQVLLEYNIKAGREEKYTGVWVDPESPQARKICAIGVHLSRWVSLHGLAFNINTDLNYFSHIIPCGIQDPQKSVTSLSNELGMSVSLDEVKQKFVKKFLEVLDLEVCS
jgi:lipoyl(octanoyl) transferase